MKFNPAAIKDVDLSPAVRVLLPQRYWPQAKSIAASVGSVTTALATVLPVAAGLPVWVPATLGAVSLLSARALVWLTPQVLVIPEHQTVVAADGTVIPRAAD
jgi:hypothetical protein